MDFYKVDFVTAIAVVIIIETFAVLLPNTTPMVDKTRREVFDAGCVATIYIACLSALFHWIFS